MEEVCGGRKVMIVRWFLLLTKLFLTIPHQIKKKKKTGRERGSAREREKKKKLYIKSTVKQLHLVYQINFLGRGKRELLVVRVKDKRKKERCSKEKRLRDES